MCFRRGADRKYVTSTSRAGDFFHVWAEIGVVWIKCGVPQGNDKAVAWFWEQRIAVACVQCNRSNTCVTQIRTGFAKCVVGNLFEESGHFKEAPLSLYVRIYSKKLRFDASPLPVKVVLPQVKCAAVLVVAMLSPPITSVKAVTVMACAVTVLELT